MPGTACIPNIANAWLTLSIRTVSLPCSSSRTNRSPRPERSANSCWVKPAFFLLYFIKFSISFKFIFYTLLGALSVIFFLFIQICLRVILSLFYFHNLFCFSLTPNSYRVISHNTRTATNACFSLTPNSYRVIFTPRPLKENTSFSLTPNSYRVIWRT